MSIKTIIPIPKKRFKLVTAKIVLFILRRGLQSGSKVDPDIKNEVIHSFPDGYSISMGVWPNGPEFFIKKRGNRFVNNKRTQDRPHLMIYFKNLESAFMVFTAQIGIPDAVSQHRIFARGDTMKVMAYIRCMNILQRHLFPGFIARKIMGRLPKMGFKKQMIRCYLYLIGIPLGL